MEEATYKNGSQLTNVSKTVLRDSRDSISSPLANHKPDLHARHKSSPTLPNHEAAFLQPHQENITQSTEPYYHSSPASKPRSVTQDVTSDGFNEHQMIDRSRDLPGNSAPQTVSGGVELLLILR